MGETDKNDFRNRRCPRGERLERDTRFVLNNNDDIIVPNVKPFSSSEPSKDYHQGEHVEIQLPGSLTVRSIDWLTVWRLQCTHNFGHANVPVSKRILGQISTILRFFIINALRRIPLIQLTYYRRFTVVFRI